MPSSLTPTEIERQFQHGVPSSSLPILVQRGIKVSQRARGVLSPFSFVLHVHVEFAGRSARAAAALLDFGWHSGARGRGDCVLQH